MALLSPETVQQIIAANDIVAVISGYFPVKRIGAAWKACCPFHNEKTPSFHITPSRGIFKCFGCQVGGDVIKFVQLYENISWPEAARKLAARAGIPIIETDDPTQTVEAHRVRKQLMSLHREIADWFHTLLLKEPEAEVARHYWRGRGLDGQVARNWKIGYAPQSVGRVLEWAKEKAIAERLLVEGGLVSFGDEEGRPRRGGAWFRFAGRLMFPLCNEQGEVVGFSGRILDGNKEAAKYLNSPETPIFNKGRLFFGLDKSKRAIVKTQRAVVCEGQIDLISCFENGVENVVAPLGTAFTEFHARILKRLTDEAVLCFDADAAGVKAAGRAFRELTKAGVHVRVAELPAGEDPDSLLRRDGSEAFAQRLEGAKPYVDFQLGHLSRTIDMGSIRDRLKAAVDISGNIACLGSKAAQEEAIHSVSTRLSVPTDDLRKFLGRAIREAAREQKAGRGPAPPAEEETAEQKPIAISDNAIRLLCRLLLTDQPARQWLMEQGTPEWLLELPDTELLIRLWQEKPLDPSDAASVATYVSQLGDREQSFVTSLLAERAPEGDVSHAKSAFLQLRSRRVRHLIDYHQSRLRTPGLTADEILALSSETVALNRELRDLKTLGFVPDAMVPF